ncbi:MAG: gliding motility-associated C-terminal domain-containing protein [Bacteroidetes bacterium]|nr:gliding motility-associated C-terminal domain-containing protein [Bacteroidota bacterium]
MKKFLLFLFIIFQGFSSALACESLDVNLGAEKTICAGETTLLDAGNPGMQYLWSTGETSQSITVSAAGVYFVKVTDNILNCSESDTINIFISHGPIVDLGPDTAFCSDWYFLDAGPAHAYQWSNGVTERFNTIKYSGTYSVEVFNEYGCSGTDEITITIWSDPLKLLPEFSSNCNGESIVLNAGNGTSTFKWNTGETSRQINATETGTFIVEITNPYGCISIDTAEVFISTFNEKPGEIAGCRKTCSQSTITYSITPVPGASSYQWIIPDNWKIISGENEHAITVEVDEYFGQIWVVALEYNKFDTCSGPASDGLEVEINACTELALNIPNTFTPNGDGFNDNWIIRNLENYDSNELIIHNRWGNEVFSTTNYTGDFDGRGLSDGTYYFKLKVKKPSNVMETCPSADFSNEDEFTGFVTILKR